jgi:hypothetical protein
MSRREFVFDARLPAQQPVHGGIQVILIHQFQPEQRAQGTGSRLLVEAARRGGLRGWGENARHNQSAYQIAFRGGRAGQIRLQADAAQGAERGNDMAMGQRTLDFE